MKYLKALSLVMLISLSSQLLHAKSILTCESASKRSKLYLEHDLSAEASASVIVDGHAIRFENGSNYSETNRLSDSVYVFKVHNRNGFISFWAQPYTIITTGQNQYSFKAKYFSTDPRGSQHPKKSNPGDIRTPVTTLSCTYFYDPNAW